MSEIAELNDFVKSLNADIQVIWGAMVDNSLGDVDESARGFN